MCEKYKECVQCQVFNTGPLVKEEGLDRECPFKVIATTEFYVNEEAEETLFSSTTMTASFNSSIDVMGNVWNMLWLKQTKGCP